MADLDLNDFEIGQQLCTYSERRVVEAICRKTRDRVRITVFSSEISLRAEFRRAVKMDRAMLSMLQHHSIIRFLGYGESNGALFLCTAASDSAPLSEQLRAGRRFCSEDVVEIGWQVCSALQLAHNLGLAHGGLSVDSVLLSESLQVTVIDFGVSRWIQAANEAPESPESGPALITVTALASREDVQRDLSDLARILAQLLATSGDDEDPEPGKVTMKVSMQRLLDRFAGTEAAESAQRPSSAREFQGRLGEILIGAGDDSMPLVDHRKTPATTRRSIVMELFEPSESEPHLAGALRRSATSARRSQILPIVVIAVIVIVLLLLAGQFL